MKKLLCFCAICNIMIIAAESQTTQGKIVGQYVNIIDPYNGILRPDRKSNEASLDEKEVTGIKGFDASTISKIVNGKIILKLSGLNILDDYDNNTINNLKKVASSWFTEENKRLLTITILDIIKEDTFINEHNISFTKFFKSTKEQFLNKESYDFWELMVQSLFYTTRSDIDINTQNEYLFDNDESNKNIKDTFKNYIQQVKKQYPENIYSWDEKAATLVVKKADKTAENDLIITPIRNPESNPVETAASTSNSQNSDDIPDDNAICKSTIAVDEKYMTCRYCNKIELNNYALNDSDDPYLGKCSVSGNHIYKHTDRCKHFHPNYKHISNEQVRGLIRFKPK